ncbi:DUF427 domain-containing protein [Streptomyces sp. NBC_01198]|uniref:DUF427 domain-containing protein n=1 Tax=Streptomyces sp. NBC_01198 TaxID=2903769 RepID=UPI002E0FEC13|nr:DUF427 domain-containing protein [Streptomyces sp. NBC_01198]
MERTVKTPGPDHPITIEPHPSRVVLRAGGRVIAETTRALTLREASYPPVFYIPLADVEDSALESTDTRTYCPYKGDATYFSLVTADDTVADAVWTYDKPYDAVSEIAGHVAFYPQYVEVTEG